MAIPANRRLDADILALFGVGHFLDPLLVNVGPVVVVAMLVARPVHLDWAESLLHNGGRAGHLRFKSAIFIIFY